MNWVKAGIVVVVASVVAAGAAEAAKCSSTGGGFETWKKSFAVEAKANGVKPKGISAFMGTSYSKGTIRADRGQHGFKLSLNAFMAKRGADGIVARGRTLKKANAALFAKLEKRYGVPPGPLLAIWGMETGFGGFLGNQNTLSAVATLAYDCRRTAFFTEHLYAALKLVERGTLIRFVQGGHAWRGRPDAIPAEEHSALWGRRRRQRIGQPQFQGRCAGFHREISRRPWLVSGRRLPAGAGQFRRDPGLEFRIGLSKGHCHHGQEN